MIEKRKAFAYITREDHLLVFTHPLAPEAGIQVPAGTIKDGEEPRKAALREAREETGLDKLRVSSFLGTVNRAMRDQGLDEIHQRHFFHLVCDQETPARWQHWEAHPSSGEAGPIPLDYYWVRMPDDVPELIADQGQMLVKLYKKLNLEVA